MKEKIIGIVIDNSYLDTIEDKDLDTPIGELGLDSLDIACIIIDIETKFEIVVDEDTFTSKNTVNDLIKLVENDKC